MAQKDKARTMRKVFQAKIAHLPYAEQRKWTEMLREMSNERNSKLAQEGKRARPVQTNAMSEAVGMRGQEPAQAPKIRNLKDIRSEVSQPSQKSISQRLAEESKSKRIEAMSQKQNEMGELFNRPRFQSTEALGDAMYGTESRLGRMGGTVTGMADRAMENALVRGPVRAIGKALPILGDMVFPYGEITGGEMYPMQDGIFVNAAGGGYLPDRMQRLNEQELSRRQANDASLQAAQTQRYKLQDPNYSPRVTGRIPINNYNAPQTYQEPQSIASTLASQEPNYEPQSIARQLSMEPVASQYTNAPQVSIAREIPEPGNAPRSLMEHYIKIYGSPERARQAMSSSGVYGQSQIQ